jgi:lysophospholipase L1-like esterase
LGPEHNVPRERINQLLRAEYSQPGTLFDIAAVQSTAPSGERVAATYEGQQLYAMYDGYSSDPGHLNPDGAAVALEAMQSVVATAVTN